MSVVQLIICTCEQCGKISAEPFETSIGRLMLVHCPKDWTNKAIAQGHEKHLYCKECAEEFYKNFLSQGVS